MDKIRIQGGPVLKGLVPISGAKNAALPLLTASLLTDKEITLHHLPQLADVSSMVNLLSQLGVEVHMKGDSSAETSTGRSITLKGTCAIPVKEAPYDMVRKMRASILVLGPLLARFGEASVSLPGGCAIGVRPINLHLEGLKAFGADIELENGYVHARAPRGLTGGEYTFPIISVTGTENLMMAAAAFPHTFCIRQAAQEPEVQDLAHLLVKMGAKIEGIGTHTLTIQGTSTLGSAVHTIIPDRIETGTYAIAAAITGGDLTLTHACRDLMHVFFETLALTGSTITDTENGIRVQGAPIIHPVDITTAPYPGYPTDLQAQFMTLMTLAKGTSTITENIFENRFMHVAELMRLGADISIHGHTATVKGVPSLKGTDVMATDLRASVSLVLAGLVADGETIIHRIYHLDRGYEHIEEKLRRVGALIERIA